MADSQGTQEDKTTSTILLLGDEGCGKSTFLSRLKTPQGRPFNNTNSPVTGYNSSDLLSDSDQPFIYNIRFSKKSFTLEFYDTASPNHHWTSLRPDVVVLAFDISNRETLDGLKGWRNDITRYFQHGYGERIPVIMLGLKRDLRVENENIIYPQEVRIYSPYHGMSLDFGRETDTRNYQTYRIAQELRCDRYAECSAVTRELLAETFEDISRTAAMATTAKGGQTSGGCNIL